MTATEINGRLDSIELLLREARAEALALAEADAANADHHQTVVKRCAVAEERARAVRAHLGKRAGQGEQP